MLNQSGINSFLMPHGDTMGEVGHKRRQKKRQILKSKFGAPCVLVRKAGLDMSIIRPQLDLRSESEDKKLEKVSFLVKFHIFSYYSRNAKDRKKLVTTRY